MALKVSWFESVQQNILNMERLLDDLTRRKPPHSHFLPKPWQPAIDIYKFVEAAEMAGKGALTLTGRLGDVMQESARAARPTPALGRPV